MAEQLSNKRQRLNHNAQRSQASALNEKQREAIQAAQQLEHNVAIDEQLHRLSAGRAQKGEVSWSRHNLVAYASTSSLVRPSTEAHVVLRYAGAQGLAATWLYPSREQPSVSQPSSSSPNILSQSVNTHCYDDPTSIAFSPCGFYLSAFFPPRDRTSSERPTDSSTADPETSAKDLFDSAEGLASGPIPIIGQPSGIQSAPHRNSLATGKLCIWSRAGTGALNDWFLAYSVPVSEESGRKAGRNLKTENVLKVDEHGHQIAEEATQSPQAKILIRGGVLQAIWLNQRRKTVLCTSSTLSKEFARLAARGPAFLPSTSDVEPDANLALLVFGRQGQVSLLYSRHCDPDTAGTVSAEGSMSFSVLQSALHVPCVHPAPATLDSETFDEDAQEPKTLSYPSASATDDADISHISVGMLANSSTILVASKRLPFTNAAVDLTEITIDLTGEIVSMITRPVHTLSLVSSHNDADVIQEQLFVDDESAVMDLGPQHLSSLSWAEVDGDSIEQTDTTKLASLRLLATFACRREAALGPSPDLSERNRQMDSMLKVWDLYTIEKELSEAFASLDCRKSGHAPKWLDWQSRLAKSSPLDGKAITSVLASALGLPLKGLGLITVLEPSSEPGGLPVEQIYHLDLNHLEIVMPPKSAPLPSSASLRTSDLAVSPNGVLAAVLSSVSSKHMARKMIMWQLPNLILATTEGQENSDASHSRCSRLVALACLRRTDAVDVARSLAPISTDKYPKLLTETAGLLQMTTSAKKVATKLESGGSLPTDTSQAPRLKFGHLLRLLQLHTLLGGFAGDSSTQLERFILELGLCLQMLRLARVKVDHNSPDIKSDDKDKSSSTSPTSTSSAGRVYYDMDGVWPILAQMHWLLTLLDRLARMSVLSATDKDDQTFEQGLVKMLNTVSVPRRLTLEILARFCDFKEWLLSTTRKQNLPPPRTHSGSHTKSEDGANSSWGTFNSIPSSMGTGLTAVSEQMELARDALRHILVSSSVGLDEFTRVLRDLDDKAADGAEKGSASTWWSELSARCKVQSSATGVSDSEVGLLKSLLDPQTGAVLDVLTLFLSPADLLDERSVLLDTLATIPVTKGQSPALVRDIVRKLPLKNAMSQSAIRKMALSYPSGLDSGAVVMRRKTCVRCHAFSQDAVVVSTTAISVPSTSRAITAPTVQYSVHTKPHRVVRSASSMPSFEDHFKYTCLCGGGWWVAQ